jgi:hypothetical protein
VGRGKDIATMVKYQRNHLSGDKAAMVLWRRRRRRRTDGGRIYVRIK